MKCGECGENFAESERPEKLVRRGRWERAGKVGEGGEAVGKEGMWWECGGNVVECGGNVVGMWWECGGVVALWW